MKLPSKGSKARIIIDFLLLNSPIAITEARTLLSQHMSRSIAGTAITDLHDRGLIYNLYGDDRHARQDDLIALTDSARELLDDEYLDPKPKADLPIVPPRVVNVLQSPALSPSLYLNTKGTREGSDWSQFKSRQL